MADMIAYADKHPDAAIFASTDQQSMLYNCMMYSQDSFIDWGSQSCNFNNQEFKGYAGIYQPFSGGVRVEGG